MPDSRPPYRLLFLCTGNSARSQMAEALLNKKSEGSFYAESAGSRPAERVNPHAIRALSDVGIEWKGKTPRGLDAIQDLRWDFIITVCDNAKEACPVFPGQPTFAHWGMEDPAEVQGTDEEKQRAFERARNLLARRIDWLLAVPAERLDSVSFPIAD